MGQRKKPYYGKLTKKKVIDEYLETSASMAELSRLHGILGSNTVATWIKRHRANLGDKNTSPTMKRPPPEASDRQVRAEEVLCPPERARAAGEKKEKAHEDDRQQPVAQAVRFTLSATALSYGLPSCVMLISTLCLFSTPVYSFEQCIDEAFLCPQICDVADPDLFRAVRHKALGEVVVY